MTYMQYLEQQLLKAAESQTMVLFDLVRNLIFADHPEAQHIRVIAPEPIRIDRIRGRSVSANRTRGRFWSRPTGAIAVCQYRLLS
jgi:hypothetical protein